MQIMELIILLISLLRMALIAEDLVDYKGMTYEEEELLVMELVLLV